MQPLPQYRPNDLFETSFQPHMTVPGFFPGTGGYFHGHLPKSKQYLFFGTDFGPRGYQRQLESAGGEPATNATIRNLRSVVEKAKLPLEACFLTNAVLCTRMGESATEDFPIWERYPDYVAECARWHREFVAAHRPKLVALMGTPHLKHFGPMLFPELAAHWRGCKTLAEVFRASREALTLRDGTLVLLMHHPSHWQAYPKPFTRRVEEHLAGLAA